MNVDACYILGDGGAGLCRGYVNFCWLVSGSNITRMQMVVMYWMMRSWGFVEDRRKFAGEFQGIMLSCG